MIRKEELFLNDILQNINDIENFSRSLTRKSFETNVLKQKAIIKSIEIIGEAVKNISEELKNKYPKVEWKEIAGTRDRISHAYFAVDFNIVWDIIKHYLPILKKQIQEIKKNLKQDQTLTTYSK